MIAEFHVDADVGGHAPVLMVVQPGGMLLLTWACRIFLETCQAQGRTLLGTLAQQAAPRLGIWGLSWVTERWLAGDEHLCRGARPPALLVR